jgi:hypothetical protein
MWESPVNVHPELDGQEKFPLLIGKEENGFFLPRSGFVQQTLTADRKLLRPLKSSVKQKYE